MSIDGIDIGIENLSRALFGSKIFIVFELNYCKKRVQTEEGFLNFRLRSKILLKKPMDNIEELAEQIGF